MTMMSEISRSRWRNVLLAVTAAVATASTALPQSSNAAKPISDEGEYSTWDVGGFFGTQWFQLYQETTAQNHLLLPKIIVGARAGEDFGRYFGLEGVFGVGFNRLALLPYGGSAYATVSERNYQLAVHGVFYLAPRTKRYRPFLDFGPTAVIYSPSGVGSLKLPTCRNTDHTASGFPNKDRGGDRLRNRYQDASDTQVGNAHRLDGPVDADTELGIAQRPWGTGLYLYSERAQREWVAVYRGTRVSRRIPRASAAGSGCATATATSATTACAYPGFGYSGRA